MKIAKTLIIPLVVAFFIGSFACSAGILEVDLSVVNQITITATSEASAVTASGPDGNGFYRRIFLV